MITASDFVARSRSREHAIAREPLLRDAREQVQAYFAKRLRRFDLPLAFEGTAFQCAVWQVVSQLEFGALVSYADIARAIGKPLAHGGVAAAMGKSPFDLFVPAHRVVGADGRVRGAGGGSLRRKLLVFEGNRRAARVPAATACRTD